LPIYLAAQTAGNFNPSEIGKPQSLTQDTGLASRHMGQGTIVGVLSNGNGESYGEVPANTVPFWVFK
jgi:hypothetical protein